MEEFFKNKKINNFIKNSLCVFSQTESMHKDFLKRNIKSFYFPNFKKIDNEPMNLTDRFAKPYKLVFLSSLRTKKGVELLIETVKKIPSNLVLLDLYGPIRKDFNKNILNVLPNNIAYKGFVRKENVTRVLAKYDLFIFPTFYEKEGFPSVILDAFAAGLPVVASNINFNSEIVKHLRNGFIFDYMSKNALYSTIIQALENVEKLKQISLNNIEDVKQYELKKVLNLVFHDLETICRR